MRAASLLDIPAYAKSQPSDGTKSKHEESLVYRINAQHAGKCSSKLLVVRQR
jgi:hypothetical protein